MFNTNCYGNESIPSYTQGVEAAWPSHTTHSNQNIFHQHAVASNPNAFVGYGLGQVQSKELDLAGVVGMKETAGTTTSTSAATNAWHHSHRMRYSSTAAASRGFLPYQMSSLPHYDSQPVDTTHLTHGTHHQFWMTNPNAYSFMPNYNQRDHNTYTERADTSRSTAAVRHNTAMPNRNYTVEDQSRNVNATLQQQPAEVLSQHCQRSSRQPIHQLQQHQQMHHQQEYLRNQLTQRERDPCQYTNSSYHQESVRVGVDTSLYHDQHVMPSTQHQHPQYQASQEALRKAETERRAAFTSRQAWPQTWAKTPYVPFDTSQAFLPNRRSSGSAFQPCSKQAGTDPYSMDSIWAKSAVPTPTSHVAHATNHTIPPTNNHIPLPTQSWLHDTTSHLKSNVYRPPQEINQVPNVPSNFSTNVLNLDTGQVELSMSVVPPELSLYSQAQRHRTTTTHPASVPVQPRPLPSPAVPQNHLKSVVKETPPKPVESAKPTSTARAAGLDVRQFLATWDEDLDIATPRPAVVENDEPDPPDPPATSLVVLDYQNVPSEEAAGLFQMYPGLQLSGNDSVVLLDNTPTKTNVDFVLSRAVPTTTSSEAVPATASDVSVSQSSSAIAVQSTAPGIAAAASSSIPLNNNNFEASPCNVNESTNFGEDQVDQPLSQESTTPISVCGSDSEKQKKTSLRLFRKRKTVSAESDASSQCSEITDECPAKSMKSDNSLSNWLDTIDGSIRTPVSVSSSAALSPLATIRANEISADVSTIPESTAVSVITMNRHAKESIGRSMPDIFDEIYEADQAPCKSVEMEHRDTSSVPGLLNNAEEVANLMETQLCDNMARESRETSGKQQEADKHRSPCDNSYQELCDSVTQKCPHETKEKSPIAELESCCNVVIQQPSELSGEISCTNNLRASDKADLETIFADREFTSAINQGVGDNLENEYTGYERKEEALKDPRRSPKEPNIQFIPRKNWGLDATDTTDSTNREPSDQMNQGLSVLINQNSSNILNRESIDTTTGQPSVIPTGEPAVFMKNLDQNAKGDKSDSINLAPYDSQNQYKVSSQDRDDSVSLEPVDFTYRNPGDFSSRETSDLAGRETSDSAIRKLSDITSKDPSDSSSQEPFDLSSQERGGFSSQECSDLKTKDPSDFASRRPSDVSRPCPVDSTSWESSDVMRRLPVDITCRERSTLTNREPSDLTIRDISDLTRRETTDLTSRDTTDSTGQEIIDSASQEITDSASQEITDSASQEITDSASQENTDSASQENTDSASQENTDSSSQENIDSASQENIDSATQENIDSASQENTDSASQENTDSASQENTDSTSQENTDSTSQETTDMSQEHGGFSSQDLNDFASREPSDFIHREPGDVTRKSPIHFASREPGDAARKSPIHFASRDPGDFIHREPGDVARKSPINFANREPSGCIHRESGDASRKSPIHFASREPGDAATKSPIHFASREPGDFIHRESGDASRKSPIHFASREPGDAATKSPIHFASREPGDFIHRESGDAARKSPIHFASREPGDFIHREPGDVARKSPINFANREPSDFIHRESGDFARKSPIHFASHEPSDIMRHSPVNITSLNPGDLVWGPIDFNNRVPVDSRNQELSELSCTEQTDSGNPELSASDKWESSDFGCGNSCDLFNRESSYSANSDLADKMHTNSITNFSADFRQEAIVEPSSKITGQEVQSYSPKADTEPWYELCPCLSDTAFSGKRGSKVEVVPTPVSVSRRMDSEGSQRTTKYLSRIVGSAPGKIPKILLSRLKNVRDKKGRNGVVKKLPSIRLTRVQTGSSRSENEPPEYVCRERGCKPTDQDCHGDLSASLNEGFRENEVRQTDSPLESEIESRLQESRTESRSASPIPEKSLAVDEFCETTVEISEKLPSPSKQSPLALLDGGKDVQDTSLHNDDSISSPCNSPVTKDLISTSELSCLNLTDHQMNELCGIDIIPRPVTPISPFEKKMFLGKMFRNKSPDAADRPNQDFLPRLPERRRCVPKRRFSLSSPKSSEEDTSFESPLRSQDCAGEVSTNSVIPQTVRMRSVSVDAVKDTKVDEIMTKTQGDDDHRKSDKAVSVIAQEDKDKMSSSWEEDSCDINFAEMSKISPKMPKEVENIDSNDEPSVRSFTGVLKTRERENVATKGDSDSSSVCSSQKSREDSPAEFDSPLKNSFNKRDSCSSNESDTSDKSSVCSSKTSKGTTSSESDSSDSDASSDESSDDEKSAASADEDMADIGKDEAISGKEDSENDKINDIVLVADELDPNQDEVQDSVTPENEFQEKGDCLTEPLCTSVCVTPCDQQSVLDETQETPIPENEVQEKDNCLPEPLCADMCVTPCGSQQSVIDDVHAGDLNSEPVSEKTELKPINLASAFHAIEPLVGRHAEDCQKRDEPEVADGLNYKAITGNSINTEQFAIENTTLVSESRQEGDNVDCFSGENEPCPVLDPVDPVRPLSSPESTEMPCLDRVVDPDDRNEKTDSPKFINHTDAVDAAEVLMDEETVLVFTDDADSVFVEGEEGCVRVEVDENAEKLHVEVQGEKSGEFQEENGGRFHLEVEDVDGGDLHVAVEDERTEEFHIVVDEEQYKGLCNGTMEVFTSDAMKTFTVEKIDKEILQTCEEVLNRDRGDYYCDEIGSAPVEEVVNSETACDIGGKEISWREGDVDVVLVPLECVQNGPHAEEKEGTPCNEVRLEMKCSLSWDRILNEGQGLVLGPANVEVRVPGEAVKENTHWKVVTRERKRPGTSKTSFEENNNVMPDVKSPIIVVKRLVLKRPKTRRSQRRRGEQDALGDFWKEAATILPPLKTKAALKAFQAQTEVTHLRNRNRSWPAASGNTSWKGRSLKRRRSDLSPPARKYSCPSPQRLPKVIIKKTGPQYQSFICGDDIFMQPVVLIERNAELDNLALTMRSKGTSSGGQSPQSDGLNQTKDTKIGCVSLQRRKRKQAKTGRAGQLMKVVELLQQWRQAEQEAVSNASQDSLQSDCEDAIENNNSLLCLDNNADDDRYILRFHPSDTGSSSSREGSFTNDCSYNGNAVDEEMNEELCLKCDSEDEVGEDYVVEDKLDELVDTVEQKDNLRDNIGQRDVPRDNSRQYDAQEDYMMETTVSEDNIVETALKEDNFVGAMAKEDNIREENGIEDNIVERSVLRDDIVEENVVGDNVVEKNFARVKIVVKNVERDNIVEENVVRDHIVDKNVGDKIVENVVGDNIDGDVLERNIAEEDLIEEITVEDSVQNENIMQEAVQEKQMPDVIAQKDDITEDAILNKNIVEEVIDNECVAYEVVKSPIQESIVQEEMSENGFAKKIVDDVVQEYDDTEKVVISTLQEADCVLQEADSAFEAPSVQETASALLEEVVVREADSALQDDVYEHDIRQDVEVSCTEKDILDGNALSPEQSRRTSIEEELGMPLICQVCGFTTTRLEEQANHIRTHSYHCQRCQLAFSSHEDFKDHMVAEHPTIEELHHCLLCQRTFPTAERHAQHKKGWHHIQMERSQRHTIHSLYRFFTGSDCPYLPSLAPEEVKAFDWLPSDPGVIHFYHDATPLQLAVQDCGGAKDDTETC